ncbi:hypothetical protein ACHAW6_003146 [Cyclotella cf. meneghiniana]
MEKLTFILLSWKAPRQRPRNGWNGPLQPANGSLPIPTDSLAWSSPRMNGLTTYPYATAAGPSTSHTNATHKVQALCWNMASATRRVVSMAMCTMNGPTYAELPSPTQESLRVRTINANPTAAPNAPLTLSLVTKHKVTSLHMASGTEDEPPSLILTLLREQYVAACLKCHRGFTPLVYSVDDMPCKDARIAKHWIACLLAKKWNFTYSDMASFIQTQTSLAIVQSNTLLLHGNCTNPLRQYVPTDSIAASCTDQLRNK